MKNMTWKMRVGEEELEKWKNTATEDGTILSEWIRKLCNRRVEEWEEASGKADDRRAEGVSRTGKVRKDGGRESVPGRAGGGVPEGKGGGSGRAAAECEHGRGVGEYCGFCFGPAKRVKG